MLNFFPCFDISIFFDTFLNHGISVFPNAAASLWIGLLVKSEGVG